MRTSSPALALLLAGASGALPAWASAEQADAQERSGADPEETGRGAPDGERGRSEASGRDDAAPAEPEVELSAPALDRTGTPALPPRDPPVPPLSSPPGKRRPVPRYDGRRRPPPTAREGLAWAPRALLFPAHAVTEYGLRRPTFAAVTWADKSGVWARIYDAFTWDEGRAGVYPIFSIEIGLKNTVGLVLFARELFVPQNDLRLSASVGRDGALDTNAQDRLRVFRDGSGQLYLRGAFTHRPDGVFYGIGGATRSDDKTYFAYTAQSIAAGLSASLGGLHRAVLELGFRRQTFGESRGGNRDRTIGTRYGGPGQPPYPPGFEGYALLRPRVGLVLDSRSPRLDVTPGTGVRFEVDGGYALDPTDTARSFASWGAAGSGFYDFSGARHVVGLELATRFVEPIGDRDVPFTELATLGGLEHMRGFLGGRLRERSAIALTAQYRYPFWTFLDAELFAGVGNVFPGHLRGLRPARLYGNGGFAVRTTFARDTSFALTLALASARFDDPRFRLVDSTRFSLGVTHGF
jgi:hypothetical protein